MWKPRIKLIEEWKLARKFWSIRLGAIGTAVTSLFILWPDSALYFWGAMPEEVKAWIPPQYVPLIGVFIFAMSMFARLVKQQKVEQQIREKRNDQPSIEEQHY